MAAVDAVTTTHTPRKKMKGVWDFVALDMLLSWVEKSRVRSSESSQIEIKASGWCVGVNALVWGQTLQSTQQVGRHSVYQQSLTHAFNLPSSYLSKKLLKRCSPHTLAKYRHKICFATNISNLPSVDTVCLYILYLRKCANRDFYHISNS